MTSRFFTGKHLAEQIRPLLRCSARARALSPIVLLVAATGALMPLRAAGAFGLTEDGKDLVVDSGAGLVFRVVKTTGDIASIR